MQNDNRQSRTNKFEKRRKNTKQISILMVIAGVLLLILLAFWIFGGKDKDGSDPDRDAVEDIHIEEKNNDLNESENVNEDSNQTANQHDENSENDMVEEDTEGNEQNENDDSDDNAEVETEEIESTDDNVIEAYTGKWQPNGTIQEGPHTTNYDDGSQDRIEIKQAVMSATGLGEDLTEHWIGNGGDQKVIATVANPGNTEIYRVYLSWIDQEGWQVTQIERLKEVEK